MPSRRRVARLIVMPLFAGCLALGCGGSPGGGGEPTPPNDDDGLLTGAGAVNGYVYIPAAAASVRAAGPVLSTHPLSPAEWEPVVAATIEADTGQYALTNEHGVYWMAGVPAGTRHLTLTGATAEGAFDVVVEDGGTTTGTVPPSETAAGSTAVICGYLYRKSDGSGLILRPGERPELTPAQGASLSVDTGQTGTADEAGYYEIAGVPPGSHTVTVAHGAEGATFTVLAAAGRVTSGTGRLPVNWGACVGYVGAPLAAQNLQQLTIAADPTEVAPVEGALVTLDDGQRMLTRTGGRYAFTGVDAGLHAIRVAASSFLEFTGHVIVANRTLTHGLEIPRGQVRRVTVDSLTGVYIVQSGSALRLRAIAYDPQDRPYAGYRLFTWTSSNTGVATVDSRGVVIGGSAGTAAITAEVGGVEGHATITVVPGATEGLQRIDIFAARTDILVGGNVQLVPTAYDASGAEMQGVQFAWSSADPDVALVDPQGVVSGARVGQTNILCAAGGVQTSTVITVSRPARRIGVEPGAVLLADTEDGCEALVTDASPTPGSLLHWTAASSHDWLSVAPAEGWGEQLVGVAVDRSGRQAGVYVGLVRFDGAGSWAPLRVEMTVTMAHLTIGAAGTVPEGTERFVIRAVVDSVEYSDNVVAGELPIEYDMILPAGAAEITVTAQNGAVVLATAAVAADLAPGQSAPVAVDF